MIARFFIMWLFFSSIAAAWMFWMGSQEKTVTKGLLKKGLISAAVGLVVIVILALVNNIQGI